MNKFFKNKKGLSFLEVIIAIFIFSLIMAAAARSFSNFVATYRSTKAVQKDLENAQYSINLMAKVIRTGNVINCNGSNCSVAGDYTSISIYDYSQRKCIIYRFSGNKLQASSADVPASDPGDGSTCAFSSSYSDMTTGYVESGKFYVIPTIAGSAAGRVSVSLSICQPNASSSGCSTNPNDKSRIQTTVSLRNLP